MMILLRVLTLLCVLMPVWTPQLEGGFWEKIKGLIWNTDHRAPPAIDVLIVNNQPSVMLEVKGKYRLYDPNTDQYISKRYVGKRKPVEAMSSGLKWGEEFPGTYQLHIVPEDLSQTIVVDGMEYQGSLLIYDTGGTIGIVNRISIEEYLQCILPQQFDNSLPEETLAAIAIAARTNAFYHVQNTINKFWDVDALYVGYRGRQKEEEGGNVKRAIQMTRHMVLSETGAYEGIVTPFAAQWESLIGGQLPPRQRVFSLISLQEAKEMGKHDKHAAHILSKAFPGTHIEMIY